MRKQINRQVQYVAVSLIVASVLSSCAPAMTSAPDAPLVASPQEAAPAAGATELSVPVSPEAAATPTEAVEVQAVATSRGPDLEATDPSTVKLDSGQLQLVEFFRFT